MSAPTTAGVRAEPILEGAGLRIVLDSGKGNVIDSGVSRALARVASKAQDDPRLACLILDHAGPHFSYGASVPEHRPESVADMLAALHDAARGLLATRLPILAVVRGLCLGGGLELALLADRIFAAEDAKLGQPELQLGVFAPLGSALLPRRISLADATDLLLSGRTLSAEEAHRIGLVHDLSPDPGAGAEEWARKHLAPKSASSLRLATAAARRPWMAGFLADLEALEKSYLEELMQTHDATEGITAFEEKRDPRWEHR